MKSLVLLDANHLMHRAYWAIQRNLMTSSGEQTNAVFGVASMLLTLIAREHPGLLVACFDEGSDTVRHEEFKDYKGGRAETPDDFYAQIPRVIQCFDAFSVPTISHPKYEADDLIATVAMQGKERGYDVIIVTGDRDLFQLADGNIRIAVPHKGYTEPEYMDAKRVENKLGVTPDQVPDYKGLVGDSSDNLKGVKGIGPKTAASLLQKYENLEGVYEHLADIKEGTRKKLEEDKESAFQCRKLATLIADVDHPFDFEKGREWGANLEYIEKFFTELEFYTLRRRLQGFLKTDPEARQMFLGEVSLDIPEEAPKGERVTEDQLPLLD